jgi:hypothetical protein
LFVCKIRSKDTTKIHNIIHTIELMEDKKSIKISQVTQYLFPLARTLTFSVATFFTSS